MPQNKAFILSTKNAAANKTGIASIPKKQNRVNLSNLNIYRNNLVDPIKEIYDLLYNLIFEINQLSFTRLTKGELASYSGFDHTGDFNNSTVDWNKLTYFIAFKAPFSNTYYEKYFMSASTVAPNLGNWYKKANEIRLKYWEFHNGIFAASFPLDIKRLCLNGEQEIFSGNISSIIDGITPKPINKKYTTRGDYSLFDVYVPQELQGIEENYFSNYPNIENSEDDSGISLDYYLTASLVENEYFNGKWKSKIHRPPFPSGYTISFGLDMGTSLISNFNDPLASEKDHVTGNEKLPNTNQNKEFTLNYYLLCVSSQWRNFTKSEKEKLYNLTSRGINNIRRRILPNEVVRLDNEAARLNYENFYDILKQIDLKFSPSNPIGGYKNALIYIIPFWERYYFEKVPNISYVEKTSGSGNMTKIYSVLSSKGLKTEANIVERTVITIIGINAPNTIGNNFQYFGMAINKHDLLLLAEGVYKCGANNNSKKKTLEFSKREKVKNYFLEVHKNEIERIQQIDYLIIK